jgi:hypothetical protein
MTVLNGHIPGDKLLKFMLGRCVLSEEEDEHLAHCEGCFRRMVETTRQYLQKPDSGGEKAA